jgi:hypothetical protein
VGIPVTFAIFLFAAVIPSALFTLKERPGIGVDFFLAIVIPLSKYSENIINLKYLEVNTKKGRF